jgi:hypothetical protein
MRFGLLIRLIKWNADKTCLFPFYLCINSSSVYNLRKGEGNGIWDWDWNWELGRKYLYLGKERGNSATVVGPGPGPRVKAAGLDL